MWERYCIAPCRCCAIAGELGCDACVATETVMSTMDEKSLFCLRRTPPEEFTRNLRASLLQQSERVEAGPRRVGRAVSLAVACIAIGAAFCVPSVRAAAT